MDKREAITASDLGPVVSLMTWILEAAVVIAVGVKFTLSSIIPGERRREDGVLILATVSNQDLLQHLLITRAV